MKYCCDACKMEQACEADDEINPETALPHQWHKRCIEEHDYILCDVCGNIRHFKGGVSAYLLEALHLPDHARADVSAEMAVNTRGRRRPRRNWTFN